jgi:hypothetical protein
LVLAKGADAVAVAADEDRGSEELVADGTFEGFFEVGVEGDG